MVSESAPMKMFMKVSRVTHFVTIAGGTVPSNARLVSSTFICCFFSLYKDMSRVIEFISFCTRKGVREGERGREKESETEQERERGKRKIERERGGGGKRTKEREREGKEVGRHQIQHIY